MSSNIEGGRGTDSGRDTGRVGVVRTGRRFSRETKPSVKTSELIVYVVAVLGVLIASATTDAQDFGAQEAWQYITWLTIGYLLSRGLAKSGSHDFDDDDDDR